MAFVWHLLGEVSPILGATIKEITLRAVNKIHALYRNIGAKAILKILATGSTITLFINTETTLADKIFACFVRKSPRDELELPGDLILAGYCYRENPEPGTIHAVAVQGDDLNSLHTKGLFDPTMLEDQRIRIKMEQSEEWHRSIVFHYCHFISTRFGVAADVSRLSAKVMARPFERNRVGSDSYYPPNTIADCRAYGESIRDLLAPDTASVESMARGAIANRMPASVYEMVVEDLQAIASVMREAPRTYLTSLEHLTLTTSVFH